MSIVMSFAILNRLEIFNRELKSSTGMNMVVVQKLMLEVEK